MRNLNKTEWNLYDNQGQPMGHFHSTPLQLLVERGLPALLLWLWVLWIYGRTLRRGFGIRDSDTESDLGLVFMSSSG